jgi:hypothetical protein
VVTSVEGFRRALGIKLEKSEVEEIMEHKISTFVVV